MAEELQQLLEKIQRDGVDKANAEAAAIVAKAKAEADALVKKAQEAAAAAEAKGKADADAYAARARETIAQAARDTVLKVKDDVTNLLTKLLAQDVTSALASEAVPIAAAAVKELVSASDAAEVAASAKLVEALRAQLAAQAQGGVKVVADEMTGAGFTVKLDNGRVEHDFTDAAIANALAQRLRADLAALLK
jgi:V/A-type H+-transporting ATPase subunit E